MKARVSMEGGLLRAYLVYASARLPLAYDVHLCYSLLVSYSTTRNILVYHGQLQVGAVCARHVRGGESAPTSEYTGTAWYGSINGRVGSSITYNIVSGTGFALENDNGALFVTCPV